MATKSSFGNGYGINRGLSAEKHLGTAIPPHSGGATVKPGFHYSCSDVGRTGKKHFDGAKIANKGLK